MINCLNEFGKNMDNSIFKNIIEPPILNTKNSKLNNLSKDFYNFILKVYKRGVLDQTDAINAQQSEILLEEIKSFARGIKLNYSEELLQKYYEETNWNICEILDGIMETKSALQEFEEKTNEVVKIIAIVLGSFALLMLLLLFSA